MSSRIRQIAGVLLALSSATFVAVPLATTAPTLALAQERTRVSAEFRLALEPYGEFRTHPRWGQVWIPHVGRDWRPYTVGHWVNSDDYGWYWISDGSEADWGWVAFHYGRWVFDRDLGWIWVPGRIWGPAFVHWRRGGGYVGWAPEPPDDIIAEVRDDPDYWDFVRANDFLAPSLVTVLVPFRERDVLIERTVIENRTVIFSDRGFAVNPGVSPAIIAAAVRRPINTFQVRPVVVAGTANIQGATVVQSSQLRQSQQRATFGRQAIAVQQTRNVVQPARSVPPPQPLAAKAPGRLGDHPPRAAQGAAGTIGAAPTQAPPAQTVRPGEQRGPNALPSRQPPPAVQGPQRTPSATTGQGTAQPSKQPNVQPNLGNERRGQGAQQRERGGAPNLQNTPRTPSGTTGQAPPTHRNLGVERREPGAQQRERGGAQAAPPSPQTLPSLRERGQRSGTTGVAPTAPGGRNLNQEPRRESPSLQNRAPQREAPPAARQAPSVQPPTARGPSPQAPAARGPELRPSAPAARGPEPRPSAPAAQAPRAAPSTTGAAPREGGGPRGERR